MENFEYSSKKELEELKNIFVNKIKDDFAEEKLDNGLTKYKSVIQDIEFVCAYDDEELDTIVSCCINIIEHLKHSIDSGYGLQDLHLDYQEKAGSSDDAIRDTVGTMACVEKIIAREPEIVGILDRLYTAVRVGGAWLMFLSRPMFHSAIFSTYEILCKYKEGITENVPENTTLYAIYFLTRAAMKMHSEEVSANNNK